MNIIFCIFVTQWFCEILISGVATIGKHGAHASGPFPKEAFCTVFEQ